MGSWTSKTVPPRCESLNSSNLFNYINNVLKKTYPGKVVARWNKFNKLEALSVVGLSEAQMETLMFGLKETYPNDFEKKDLPWNT